MTSNGEAKRGNVNEIEETVNFDRSSDVRLNYGDYELSQQTDFDK